MHELLKALKAKQKKEVHLIQYRGWSYHRILCPEFFLPPTYLEVQLVLQKSRSTVYSFFWNFDCRKKRKNNLQSQLEYRHSPRGVHMSQKRWGELQARLDINHPIPTLHPDSCFQWIVAWYSWYLRAVTNRIGSKLHGTEFLVDFSTACNHPSGRESKASTKRSARDSPPSLGMRDGRLL